MNDLTLLRKIYTGKHVRLYLSKSINSESDEEGESHLTGLEGYIIKITEEHIHLGSPPNEIFFSLRRDIVDGYELVDSPTINIGEIPPKGQLN